VSLNALVPCYKVLSERPSDASAVFEHLSASVKEGTVKPANTIPSLGEQAAAEAQIKWAQSSQALFAVPDEPPEGGAVVPDMLDEANMWEWGGVSFGRLETYRLYLSVKKVGYLPDLFGRNPTAVRRCAKGRRTGDVDSADLMADLREMEGSPCNCELFEVKIVDVVAGARSPSGRLGRRRAWAALFPKTLENRQRAMIARSARFKPPGYLHTSA